MATIRFGDSEIRPGKIVCVGRNYAEHARELNNPLPTAAVFFMKPASAIAAGPLAPARPARFEAELSFLVRDGRLAAVALGLDLTLGAEQERLKRAGLPWERAKAFRSSAVFSPFVAFDAARIAELRLELDVNGAPRQRGAVSDMIFSPAALLEEIEAWFGLEDGDVIMTGTPAGVGELVAGDRLRGAVRAGDELLLEVEWSVAATEFP